MATWGRHTSYFNVPWCNAAVGLNLSRKLIFFTVWMGCEWNVFVVRVFGDYVWVFVYICKNLHSDLIWSGLRAALLWPEMIGKTLSSLRGDEQRARISLQGLHAAQRGLEMMNWSDILVRDEFGVSSPSFTTDNE